MRDPPTLAFSPHLPAGLGNEITLRNLVVQGTQCEVTLRGNGRTVVRSELDRGGVSEPAIKLDGGTHRLVITLGQ